MSLTTDLTEQEEVEYETVTGIHWDISPSDKVDPVPDGTISIDFANGYTKGKADMMKKIDAIIKEIEEQKEQAEILFGHALGYEYIRTYKKCLDIIRKHIGEA